MKRFSDMSRAARLCGVTLAVLSLALACAADTRAQAGRSAGRVWVSAATGSDANPCTRAAPCRDLSSAVGAVAANGEVVILDSGGYDAFEITKSVQIVAPEGVHAVIAPTTGLVVPGGLNGETTAVLVNAPDATVILRNLTVNRPQNINHALRAAAVGTLHVEHCVFNGIDNMQSGDSAIFFAAGGRLMVRDSTARDHGIGIIVYAPPGATAHASIDRCRLDGNQTGLLATSGSRVTVSNTVAANGGGTAFVVNAAAGATSELNCDNCVASNNGSGFGNGGGAGAVMRVARSTATNNVFHGFSNNSLGSTFKSLAGTNMVEGNGTNRVGPIITFSGNTQ